MRLCWFATEQEQNVTANRKAEELAVRPLASKQVKILPTGVQFFEK